MCLIGVSCVVDAIGQSGPDLKMENGADTASVDRSSNIVSTDSIHRFKENGENFQVVDIIRHDVYDVCSSMKFCYEYEADKFMKQQNLDSVFLSLNEAIKKQMRPEILAGFYEKKTGALVCEMLASTNDGIVRKVTFHSLRNTIADIMTNEDFREIGNIVYSTKLRPDTSISHGLVKMMWIVMRARKKESQDQ